MASVLESTPPIASGDHLSRDEFLRRWRNEPALKRAELLKGVVYMPSPVSTEHGDIENIVSMWAGTYAAMTPGTAASNNSTTFLLDDLPQPDVHLRVLREFGGRSYVERGFLHGSPELVVEVCGSSAAYDLHVKFELYRQAEVQEYFAVLVHERSIRWHMLVDGEYHSLDAAADGIFRSRVFPGLFLSRAALLEKRPADVLATLQTGISSREHAAFVAKHTARKAAN